MSEFNYRIIKKIGTINKDSKWKKELNLISWDGKARKFDIRSWDENHEKMSKGITLSRDELMRLKELLNDIDIDDAYGSINRRIIDDNISGDDVFD